MLKANTLILNDKKKFIGQIAKGLFFSVLLGMLLAACGSSTPSKKVIETPIIDVKCTTPRCKSSAFFNAEILLVVTNQNCEAYTSDVVMSLREAAPAFSCNATGGCLFLAEEWSDGQGALKESLDSSFYNICGVIFDNSINSSVNLYNEPGVTRISIEKTNIFSDSQIIVLDTWQDN